MSTNLRKAQKHMQRATELLNQSQLGFGTGDDGPSNNMMPVDNRGKRPESSKNITNLPDNAISSVLGNLNCIDSQKFCINS